MVSDFRRLFCLLPPAGIHSLLETLAPSQTIGVRVLQLLVTCISHAAAAWMSMTAFLRT